MAAKTPEARRRAASIAADVQWACTPNRTERTEAARRRSPLSLEFHIAAKTEQAAKGEIREEDILPNAQNAHRAFQKQCSLKAAKARSRKADASQLSRLRKTA